MSPDELEQYLHEHIPLSAAMGVEVLHVEPAVVLRAPLGPNINHRHTAFGGSLAAIATLAAWSALRVRLGEGARLVIAEQTTNYLRPVFGDFESRCAIPDGEEWDRFLEAYARRGRARITLIADIRQAEEIAVTFSGRFVALAHAP